MRFKHCIIYSYDYGILSQYTTSFLFVLFVLNDFSSSNNRKHFFLIIVKEERILLDCTYRGGGHHVVIGCLLRGRNRMMACRGWRGTRHFALVALKADSNNTHHKPISIQSKSIDSTHLHRIQLTGALKYYYMGKSEREKKGK